MRETAMSAGGRLELTSKAWWPRAGGLKTGESFNLDAVDGQGQMLVRRERVTTRTRSCDAIVWVIDDDGDGSLARGGDRHDDCYVVDYDADGAVDRLVDYMDDDGDSKANEMDIRYFAGGELRNVWFGLDLDGDGHMWDLKGYEYSANFFASDPYGDNMIYMNKYDPGRNEFVPISECPFAFFDTDRDGQSEIAVRVSASPLSFDPARDPDYANDAARYGGPWNDVMRSMGAMNVRYSFDIDNLSGPPGGTGSYSTPLHYDMGFNMVGAVPYDVPGDRHFNAKRRPPQVTRVIPHDRLRSFCDTYPAQETGFSWHEQHDDTIAIGDPPHAQDDFRWEGVFWIWERRFMSNTGGPGQKWNVRREWSERPADRRRLYYSGIDRRIHLFGAKEAWIQIGHFVELPGLGEVRMLDSDGNGYFDRWEVYPAPRSAAGALAGDGQSAGAGAGGTWPGPTPIRVTTVRDEQARDMEFDLEALHRFYLREVLPEAMAANERILKTLARVHPFDAPPALVTAAAAGPLNMRRFAQDVQREMHYQALREELTRAAHAVLGSAKMDDLRPLKQVDREGKPNSATAWRLLRGLQDLDVAYGQGDYDRAIEILRDMEPVPSKVMP